MISPDPGELAHYLNDGERLLWTGNPGRGFVFRKQDIFILPFALFWCGFSIFWTIMATRIGGAFGLFGIPFIFIGCMLLFGRFFIDKKKREKMVYGITEDRIIILSGIFSKKVDSINLKTLTNLQFTEKSDGSGTITLGKNSATDFLIRSRNFNVWPWFPTTPDSLENIERVREVYMLITKNSHR